MDIYAARDARPSAARAARVLLLLPVVAALILALAPGPGPTAPQPLESAPPIPVGWSAGPSLPSGYVTRWDTAAAQFPPTGDVVLFGGAPKTRGEPWRNDTWLFKGASWRQGPAAPSGLSARGGAAMAYLPTIKKIVLFGGANASWPPKNDTWLWDGTNWSRGPAAPAGLLGRTGAGLVFDPTINKLVLFGGSGEDAFRDTWLFDGSSWQRGPAAPAGLQPRAFFGMAYDPQAGGVVVGGGSGGSEVFIFDGSGWKRGPSLPPAAATRERVRFAYDRSMQGTVLFGGIGPGRATNDSWILKGGEWKPFAPSAGAPSPRFDATLLWLGGRSTLMVIGGVADDGFGETVYSDTWFYNAK